MSEIKFTWIPFYTALADRLLDYRGDRASLLLHIQKVYDDAGMKLPRLESDGDPVDIDPFTVFGLFNKGMKDKNRLTIAKGLAQELDLCVPLPEDFDGIPVLNALMAVFYGFWGNREEHAIDNLWQLYDAALRLADDDTQDHRKEFSQIYDVVIQQKYIRWNITMGLYWIRPFYYLNLDSRNRWYMEEPGVVPETFLRKVKPMLKKVPAAEKYLLMCDLFRDVMSNEGYEYHSFPEFSYLAWEKSEEANQQIAKADWIPKDYDPGLSADDWAALLADPQIFTQGSLEIMKRMMDCGGEATCRQLSVKYGESANFYNSGSSYLAKRIAGKTGCPIYVKEDESTRYWPILYLGRKTEKGAPGVFTWRLRDELKEALNEVDLDNIPLYAGTALGDTDVDVNTVHYWLYAPGEGAAMWPSFYQDGIMALNWHEIGNLNDYGSKEEMRLSLQEELGGDSSYKNSAHALWQFVHEMKPGDVVFAKKGRTEILGKGIVESEYEYDEDAGEYPNIRRVRWTNKGSWQFDEILALKTLTDLTDYTDNVEKLLALFEDESGTNEQEEPVIVYPPYTEEDFLKEVYISAKEYRTLVGLLQNKKNIILQGAPGVGKTFIAKRLAYSIMGVKDTDRVTMVQFHQSYSYEDFIMGFRPSKDGFDLKKGAFYSFCKRAEVDSENDYFFIVDEINRGNLSKIFGELFMLIENDKRGSRNKLRLLYSDELFYVPENVYIVGMMNTADRSLAMLDYALRRRFAFFDLKPGFASEGFRAYRDGLNNARFDRLIQTVVQLNERIAADESLGEGFCIGHSYFCNLTAEELEEDSEKLSGIVEYELIPLLKEYWFDEPGKVREWSEILRGAVRNG